MRYIHPVTDTLRAMLALGWAIDPSGVCHEDDGTGLGLRRRQFLHSVSTDPPIALLAKQLSSRSVNHFCHHSIEETKSNWSFNNNNI